MTDHERNNPDYYQILGVPRSATLADITAAYHLRARQCHPDAGATDPDSRSRIRLINEAYAVLSDELRRRAYDHRPRRIPVSGSTDSEAASAGFPAAGAPAVPSGSRDIQVDLPVAPEEALRGAICEFTLKVVHPCESCGGHPLGAARACPACGGTGTVQRRQPYQIALPRCVRSGTIMRIVGEGKRSGSARGDLLVRIRVQPTW